MFDGLLCFTLIYNKYCPCGLFTLPLGVIGRPCSEIMAIPGQYSCTLDKDILDLTLG